MIEANPSRLRRFVGDFGGLLATDPSEAAILSEGAVLLRALLAHDDWLPDAFAQPARTYAQYLLHCDSLERFSVVSFVWSPGQGTPIHNHTVWGLVGQLRGAEIAQPYDLGPHGLVPRPPVRLDRGEVAAVSTAFGDIHRVSNALEDVSSVSIHVYGANIGAVERATFGKSGATRSFISGYSNNTLPNIWAGVATPVGETPT